MIKEPQSKGLIRTKQPVVVIVGKTNVGKSSLFNRLTESGKALISPVAGTTRDYNTGMVSWNRKNYLLIDTGGVNIENLKNSIKAILPGKKNKLVQEDLMIESGIIKQTKAALKKANLILMLVDGQSGLLAEDKELAGVLKKLNKPVILACNKIDSQKFNHQVNDFYKLGLGKPIAISAASGSGTGDLLDEISLIIKNKAGRPKTKEGQSIKVAIIGKPNVGKSSLVNQILGEERVIVSPLAQTTREPQDTEFIYKDWTLTIIDTAGLRKKAKIQPGIERSASKKTLEMIKQADLLIFLTDASEPLTVQDSHLAGLIKESKRGLIIIGNKWDLIENKTEKTDSYFKKYYYNFFRFLDNPPLMFISAKTGKNIEKVLDQIIAIWQEQNRQLNEDLLSDWFAKALAAQAPLAAKGIRRPKIRSFIQTRTNPPQFTITIGANDSIHYSYLRYLENRLREHFDFSGSPITLRIERQKRKPI